MDHSIFQFRYEPEAGRTGLSAAPWKCPEFARVNVLVLGGFSCHFVLSFLRYFHIKPVFSSLSLSAFFPSFAPRGDF